MCAKTRCWKPFRPAVKSEAGFGTRCERYVRTANAHDLPGLAAQLAADVDMFGGPCDLAGLEAFFAGYPEIHWTVTSAYSQPP